MLFSQTYDYKTDSLAVRAILDSNGLDTVPVESITECYGNRITNLFLQNRNLTIIPKDIISLTSLYGLDLSENPITNFPAEICSLGLYKLLFLNFSFALLESLPKEIGLLKNLREFFLTYNNITELPTEFCLLGDTTMYLSLAYNKLKTLPREIGNMNRSYCFNLTLDLSHNLIDSMPIEIVKLIDCNLSVNGNKLCKDIPDTVAQWLDTWAEHDWKTLQHCPFLPVVDTPFYFPESTLIRDDRLEGTWREYIECCYYAYSRLTYTFHADSFFVFIDSWTDCQNTCIGCPEDTCFYNPSELYWKQYAAGTYQLTNDSITCNGRYTDANYHEKLSGCSSGSKIWGDYVRLYDYKFSSDTLFLGNKARDYWRIFFKETGSMANNIMITNLNNSITIINNPSVNATSFIVNANSDYVLSIVDLRGNIVKSYLKSKNKKVYTWDHNDNNNTKVSSGVYLLKLNKKGNVILKPFIICR
jgi:hypothetical protein